MRILIGLHFAAQAIPLAAATVSFAGSMSAAGWLCALGLDIARQLA